MLRANQAVRLGLRAASRNPELAFARALLDQLGNLLVFLPVLLGSLFVFALVDRSDFLAAVRAVRALSWPTLGGLVAAASLSFSAGMLFWAGALPLLAADAELDRRPPAGNFALLASRGFARVLLAGLVAYAMAIAFSLACTAALFAGLPALVARPSPALLAGTALIAALSIAGSVLLDLLGRLLIMRAAAFGEGVSVAFGRAASLLGARLGACLVVSVAFLVLDLIAATVAGMLTGAISSTSFLEPGVELLALAPRIAVGLAAAAVFAWLEVGRMGALSALALDAEGLIGEQSAPPQPAPPLAEPVIEALPIEEDP
jgi:hypothetical protein